MRYQIVGERPVKTMQPFDVTLWSTDGVEIGEHCWVFDCPVCEGEQSLVLRERAADKVTAYCFVCAARGIVEKSPARVLALVGRD